MDQIGGRFFGYFGKILILSGMVLVFGSIGVLISHFLAKLFFGVDLSVISFQSIKKDDLQIIAALKLYQTIGGGIGMFLIPAFIFPAAVNYRIRVFPFHQQQVSVLPFMIGVFSILIVAPAISWLYQINQQMHFPAAWQAWETSIKEMEDQAAMLTKLFVSLWWLWYLLFAKSFFLEEFCSNTPVLFLLKNGLPFWFLLLYLVDFTDNSTGFYLVLL
jgi:hypothetical protein